MRRSFAAIPFIFVATAVSAQTTSSPPAAAGPAAGPQMLAVPPVVPPPPPPAPKVADYETVADVVARYPEYATLNRVIGLAGLAPALEEAGPYTVLAPTEAAFAKLPKGGLDKLIDAKANPALADRLKFHVVPGYLTQADLRRQLTAKGASQIQTLAGETLVARIEADDSISLTDAAGTVARFAGGERQAFNGIVLPIDAVEAPRPKPKERKRKRG